MKVGAAFHHGLLGAREGLGTGAALIVEGGGKRKLPTLPPGDPIKVQVAEMWRTEHLHQGTRTKNYRSGSFP